MEELERFKNWWLANRPFNTPLMGSISKYHDRISGVVLYRQNEYQVELFITQGNTDIKAHIHPNVDSYEVFLCGDMVFTVNGESYNQATIGGSIPVPSLSLHGGSAGKEGASFISIQRWKNGVLPSSVGYNWIDEDGNTSWNEYKK